MRSSPATWSLLWFRFFDRRLPSIIAGAAVGGGGGGSSEVSGIDGTRGMTNGGYLEFCKSKFKVWHLRLANAAFVASAPGVPDGSRWLSSDGQEVERV
mmetsp:Transcript_57683/g.103614  ORF Transcript_57683/g.103614 Transcript_57683/m.103614 type:complete len:98 (-) Transcript_57683:354-647(-)